MLSTSAPNTVNLAVGYAQFGAGILGEASSNYTLDYAANCGGGTLCKNIDDNNYLFGHTLDLFRYSAAGKLDWTTTTPSYFSAKGGTSAFLSSRFSTVQFNGNGWQASHWRAPSGNGCTNLLGLMNPYNCDTTGGIVTGRDVASLDAIGYNTSVTSYSAYSMTTAQIFTAVAVAEPASWAVMVLSFGLVGGAIRRRRRVSGTLAFS